MIQGGFMNMRRIIKVLKKAGEYFSVAAGVVSIAFAIAGALATFPLWVGLVVAGGIGLMFACLGGVNARREMKERESKMIREQQERKEALAEVHEMNVELKKLRNDLECESQCILPQQPKVAFRERAVNNLNLFTLTREACGQDEKFQNPVAELNLGMK